MDLHLHYIRLCIYILVLTLTLDIIIFSYRTQSYKLCHIIMHCKNKKHKKKNLHLTVTVVVLDFVSFFPLTVLEASHEYVPFWFLLILFNCNVSLLITSVLPLKNQLYWMLVSLPDAKHFKVNPSVSLIVSEGGIKVITGVSRST